MCIRDSFKTSKPKHSSWNGSDAFTRDNSGYSIPCTSGTQCFWMLLSRPCRKTSINMSLLMLCAWLCSFIWELLHKLGKRPMKFIRFTRNFRLLRGSICSNSSSWHGRFARRWELRSVIVPIILIGLRIRVNPRNWDWWRSLWVHLPTNLRGGSTSIMSLSKMYFIC